MKDGLSRNRDFRGLSTYIDSLPRSNSPEPACTWTCHKEPLCLALTRMRDDDAERAELVDTMESLLHKND